MMRSDTRFMDDPSVYVLVVNWNGEKFLEECFNSLVESTYLNARFILIDNASTDGSVDLIINKFGDDPRVEILRCKTNLGWSRGNNVGIRHAIKAKAKYIFMLNNDTVIEPDTIEILVGAAKHKGEIGALAPKMLFYDNPTLINSLGIECSVIASAWDRGFGRLNSSKWDKERPVAGVCGGAAFLRVKSLETAGLLPEDFDMYLDDLDLGLRIWNAGYEIVTCPRAVVMHKHSATMVEAAQLRRKYYLTSRNRFYVILRIYPLLQLPKVMVACIIGELRAIGRSIMETQLWRVAAHVRAWFAALIYIPKAVMERFRRYKAGQKRNRFWRYVRTDLMFFPGVEIPRNGWYAPRTVAGKRVQPISDRAYYSVEKPGSYRIILANGYSKLGRASVEVHVDSVHAATLETDAVTDMVVNTTSNVIELVSKRIFEAEQTGEPMDIGGWIAIEPAEK